MDSLLAKIEDLKREAECLKRTCRCESITPTRLNKKTNRNISSHNNDNSSILGSPCGLFSSGNTFSPDNLPCNKLDFEGPGGGGDWVSAFKAASGPWSGERLVVLSLFDGIGGIWQALTNLGIPFSGYSSEVLAPAIQVVKSRHPHVKHVGDVRKLNLSAIPEQVDLVVGGFPCQDLSIMGKKEGLHGSRSKLFFDLLRILQTFKPKWFLVENVASMAWVDREEITRHLKVVPMELDSQEITASKRRRLYWTNIPHPPRLPRLRDHPSTSLQSCLEDALALEQKCGVVLCNNLYKGGGARLELVLDRKTNKLRYIKQTEIELLMGYPKNYTNVVMRRKKKTEQVQQAVRIPEKATVALPKLSVPQTPSTRQLRTNRTSRNFFAPQVWQKYPTRQKNPTRQDSLKDLDRWFLLGNSFSVQVIAYLTSPLLNTKVRFHGKSVNIVGSVKEEELSAMEPGDVWALFNEHGRPNWYAVIQSRTGDRFSEMPNAAGKRSVTKLPLSIEMKYLEMTSAYAKDEIDEWNPQRGSGLLKPRDVVDIQDNWQAFSHRVTSYVKFDDSYFVYPGKDEVWAVYHAETLSRYFVYVVESTIICVRLHDDKPGQEGFLARCLLLQKTSEHEVYLKTSKTVELSDIQPFCFRVPFHIKNEANLLKVEVSGVKSRKSMRADKDSTTGYKRRKQDQGELDDDYDFDDIDDDCPEDINADDITAEEMLAGDEVLEVMNGDSEVIEARPDDIVDSNGGAPCDLPEISFAQVTDVST